MSAEPDHGTELERRGETLPDVSVAHRAGSIVSEFVSSIVEEAQARGGAIIAEAEEELRAQRVEAGEAAARIQERVVNVAPGLAELVDTLRREAAELSGEPVTETALPPRLTPAADQEGVPQDHEQMVEAVVVEEGEDEGAHQEPAAGMSPADLNGDAGEGELPEDASARVGRMSDEELARTYSNAVRAAQRGNGDDEYGTRLRDLAAAAVGEALRRPVFTEGEPAPRGALWRRAGARKRRRRAVVLGELREACRQEGEHQLAAGPPAS